METTQGRMIGQDFFDLRSRIGNALFSLGQLAQEAGADQDHQVIIENLVNSLKDPFVFVVVGEVNVGKSTLLNAIFATEITKTGVVPTTEKIYFFKHGPALKHVPISRTLEEVHVPAEFLRDFHIVDTPGTNSIENEHQEITERFVPMADLVIFVFSAMNPWGASAWQFLEKVHQHWMRHVVFVLQQCDLRTDEEIAAILDYMKQLSRQRFNHDFPIFPVSAKKAYLARSGGLDRDRLMAESGFAKLEGHISRSIGGSGQRIGKLSNALRIARDILTAIRSQSGSRIQSREDKAKVMRQVEDELESMEARTNTKLAAAIDATASDFEREAGVVLARLRSRLTPGQALASVVREKREVAGLERSLLDQVRTPSLERWGRAAVIIEDDVCSAADYLSESAAEGLKVQLRDELRPDSVFWEAQRHRFVARIEEMLQTTMHRLGLERALEPVLARTQKLARWQVVLALVGLVAGLVLAGQRQWLAAGIAVAAGAVLAGLVSLGLRRVLRHSMETAAGKLAAAHPEFRVHLGQQLHDEVRNLYDSFTRILQPAKDKLGEQEKRQSASQSQMDGLEKTFAELEAKLKAMAVTPMN